VRYRPFNHSGLSTSALTLAIPAGSLREREAFKLICGALEHGINSFEVADGDEAAAGALRQAIASVGRRVLVLMLRACGVDAGNDLAATVRAALHASDAQYFDVLMLDEACALGPAQLAQVEDLKTARLIRMAGLAGDGEIADRGVGLAQLDVVSIPYSFRSGWPERNRIKAATTRGMTIVGRDFHVDLVRAARGQGPRGLGRLFHKPNAQEQQAYSFLQTTRNWTADQIGLAFALTEPALATVQVETTSAVLVEQLAQTVERELPAGVAAQIELARFAALSVPDA